MLKKNEGAIKIHQTVTNKTKREHKTKNRNNTSIISNLFFSETTWPISTEVGPNYPDIFIKF
jgi:hypothetical protein